MCQGGLCQQCRWGVREVKASTALQAIPAGSGELLVPKMKTVVKEQGGDARVSRVSRLALGERSGPRYKFGNVLDLTLGEAHAGRGKCGGEGGPKTKPCSFTGRGQGDETAGGGPRVPGERGSRRHRRTTTTPCAWRCGECCARPAWQRDDPQGPGGLDGVYFCLRWFLGRLKQRRAVCRQRLRPLELGPCPCSSRRPAGAQEWTRADVGVGCSLWITSVVPAK